jgi:Family of unknown function (DUF6489)
MKVHIEVEISPEEARQLLGLPDMNPIHQVLASQAKSKIESLGNAVDIDPLLKTWGSMGGLAQDALTSIIGAALKPSSSRANKETGAANDKEPEA